MSETHEFTHRLDRMADALDRVANLLALLVDRTQSETPVPLGSAQSEATDDEAEERAAQVRALIEASDAKAAEEQARSIAAALERIRTGAKPLAQASNVATMSRRPKQENVSA